MMMTQRDAVVEMVRAHFPNVAKNVNRENAPVAMKKMVAAMSHEQVVENTQEGHVARQAIRDAIFARVAYIANHRNEFAL